MKNKILSMSVTCLLPAMSAYAQERPNIVFCIADDASYHHFSANGCSWVKTPNFDRVCRQGIRFSNCYTPNAKSAPSRACILTGRNSWQLREAGNHITNFPPDIKTFPEALRENGYEAAFTGKGWEPGRAVTADGQPRQLTGKPFQEHTATPPTRAMSTIGYAANFEHFLAERDRTKPFFFWCGSREPHRSYAYGSSITAGGKSLAMIERVPEFLPDNDTVRTDLLDYAFEIEYFDRQVGEMLDVLERNGLLENTIFVITSDNGMPFPRSKANNYEYANHMPLAVCWKGGIRNPGRTVEDYISFIDYAPTFLDVAGVEWEESGMLQTPGKSMTDLFRDETDKTDRSFILLGRERDDYGRPANQGYPIRAIISENMLYQINLKPHLYPAGNPEMGYPDADGGPTKTVMLGQNRRGENTHLYRLAFAQRPATEMYDLSKDIFCIRNIAEDSCHAQLRKRLHETLISELIAQDDPRMGAEGDVFDRYPFDSPQKWNFYERVMSGDILNPWEQTRWLSPTDYEDYPAPRNRNAPA
ncbi:MAG: sulfatase [Tannerella sp.]|jgi:arylsulfatase A-like enzyme|nr:sulfatase [Tannerella sp.]